MWNLIKQLKHQAGIMQAAAVFLAMIIIIATATDCVEGAAIAAVDPSAPAVAEFYLPGWVVVARVLSSSFVFSTMVIWKWRGLDGVLEDIDVDTAPPVIYASPPLPRLEPCEPGGAEPLNPAHVTTILNQI